MHPRLSFRGAAGAEESYTFLQPVALDVGSFGSLRSLRTTETMGVGGLYAAFR